MVGLNVMPTQAIEHASGILLVLSASEDTALRIERYLRNQGRPMRAAWICDLEDLADALRGNPPDMLLCEVALAAAPLERVVELCRAQAPELPILQISAELTPAAATAALAAGAQDCVCIADATHLRHLEHVVLREVINYERVRNLKRTRARLQELESQDQRLTAGTADPIARVQEGIVTEANTAFGALLGIEGASTLLGMPFIDLIAPEQRDRIKDRMRRVAKGRHDGEAVAMTLDTGKQQIEVSARLTLGSTDGEPTIEILVPHQAAAGATTEGRAALAAAMHAPPSKRLRAAVIVKLDAYSALEDRIGMIDAEAVRVSVADNIRRRLEPDDTLVTFSNDELGLIIHREEIGALEEFANAMGAGIGRQIFTTPQHEAQISASVAVYPFGVHESVDTVLRQLVTEARALSAAGGGRVLVVGETAKDKMAERANQRIVTNVRVALESGRLKLAYQAISNLEGTSSHRFDVLLRMIDEAGNESSAGEFLPQAQNAGMMRTIDRWVVTRVANLLIKRKGRETLFAKLSEDTVADVDAFLKWFVDLLRQFPINPQALVLETRETTVLTHMRKVRSLREALDGLGVGFAIEQFGIDAASAKLLDYLPVQYVKFHPVYTREFNDQARQRRLKDLLGAAQRRKIKTIISYVEDDSIMAGMWQMGANFVQGFGVQEPESLIVSNEPARKSAPA